MSSHVASTVLFLLLLCPGCLESNPQPSPGGGGGGNGKDTQGTGFGADARTPDEGLLVADALEPGAEVQDVLAGDTEAADGDGATLDGLLPELPGPDALPPECADCAPPYPGCARVQDQWVCVQCTDDGDCDPGCTCDLPTFTCSGLPCGGDPPHNCVDDGDCPEGHPCNPDAQVCFDPMGWCDDASNFCNVTAGSACKDPLQIILGGDAPGPGIPGGEGLCTCTGPIPLPDAIACLDAGTCPPGDCHPGQVCTQVSLLCSMMFGECPAPDPDAGFCMGPGLLDSLTP
ncbi:MAG: hypothetical protein ABIK09_08970 [Pseudomonadota bacterium]